jgi:hypothetical protein
VDSSQHSLLTASERGPMVSAVQLGSWPPCCSPRCSVGCSRCCSLSRAVSKCPEALCGPLSPTWCLQELFGLRAPLELGCALASNAAAAAAAAAAAVSVAPVVGLLRWKECGRNMRAFSWLLILARHGLEHSVPH